MKEIETNLRKTDVEQELKDLIESAQREPGIDDFNELLGLSREVDEIAREANHSSDVAVVMIGANSAGHCTRKPKSN